MPRTTTTAQCEWQKGQKRQEKTQTHRHTCVCVCVVGLLNSRICVQFLAICHPPPHASLLPHNAVAVQAGPIIKLHRATHNQTLICVCECVCAERLLTCFSFVRALFSGLRQPQHPFQVPFSITSGSSGGGGNNMTSRPRKTWETNTTHLPARLGAMCKFKMCNHRIVVFVI